MLATPRWAASGEANDARAEAGEQSSSPPDADWDFDPLFGVRVVVAINSIRRLDNFRRSATDPKAH
jgi:hypothetical protein